MPTGSLDTAIPIFNPPSVGIFGPDIFLDFSLQLLSDELGCCCNLGGKLYSSRLARHFPPMGPDAEFVRELTGCQHWLRAFIRTLLVRADDADEVLQRTNLVLWQKADQFTEGTNFTAWACQVARFEVMAFRTQHGRDRHQFGDEVINVIAEDAQQHPGILEDLRDHLKACLDELTADERRMLSVRYGDGGSVQAIAAREGRAPAAISTALYRLRQSLLKCIRRKIDA